MNKSCLVGGHNVAVVILFIAGGVSEISEL